ncbi:hypothetical protein BJX99DRAFT_233690 [Aspergillus californicus]
MDRLLDETGGIRKVRKGTHSCRDCRRRKVRCIFKSPADSTCIVCRRRGTKCVSQGGFTPDAVEDTQTLPPTPVSAHSASAAETATHGKTTQALLRALPCSKDVEILLGEISPCVTLCYQSNFKTSSPTEILREQISIPSLLYPNDHPVLLGRQMLLFAAALQHLSPTAVFSGLTEHHRVIMERLAESAIRLVTMNDELLGTLEGLENIILEGFYHIDSGNIRRAWITMRRAVMAAQLLGLHQPTHYRFKLINEQNSLDPAVMWTCAVAMERVLSLLLGLPTSTGDATPVVQSEESNLHALILRLTYKILQRNQRDPTEQATRDMTDEIDQELIQMTEQLPSSFWRPPALAGLKMDSAEAFRETRRVTDHMCYYMLASQLHLPYILCPGHTSSAIYSRLACIGASREILTRQMAIRTFNPVTAFSRMGDFIAVTAGMTLMLVHIVSHGHMETNNGSLLVHERLRDRAAINQALDCMKSMSELHEDVLAAKCAVLLRDLLAIEAVAAQRRHGYRGQTNDTSTELSIQVPYLGTVRVVPQGITFTPYQKTRNYPPPQESAGVTIGGIGSIQVQSPASPLSPDNQTINYHSDAGAIQAPAAQQCMSGMPPDCSLNQDQMFPDAAAGLDDWVFQGFDTAFFDTLVRGLGDQPLDFTET